ncbi:MAG: hypothetical protein ACI9K3_000980 [Halovenus sp.]|jgi:hypothetical protein
MHEHFTDAENTGAPLVPMVKRPDEVVPDGGRETEREEVVLSHRLQR